MGDVYGNAWCTISATAASDGSGGLYLKERSQKPRALRINFSETSEGLNSLSMLCHSDRWDELITNAPLNTRAWVFQERVLAPRTIHFGRGEVFWSCLEVSGASKTFPLAEPGRWKGVDKGMEFERYFPTHIADTSDEELDTIRMAYFRYVAYYTVRDLTNYSDKLIAMSGIAQKYQMFFLKSRYLAGLWEEWLPWHLLWVVHPTPQSTAKKPQKVYVAPSWSWASVNNTVDQPKDYCRRGDYLITIDDVSVQAVNNDLFGQITSGRLRLTGPLILGKFFDIEATNEEEEKKLREANRPFIDMSESLPKEINSPYYFFDTPQNTKVLNPPGSDVIWLPILSYDKSCRDRNAKFTSVEAKTVSSQIEALCVVGLLLTPTRDAKGEYRRVGWFISYDMDAWQSYFGKSVMEGGAREYSLPVLSEEYFDKFDGVDRYSIILI